MKCPKKLEKDSKENVEQIDIKDLKYKRSRKCLIIVGTSIVIFIMLSLLKLGRYDTFQMIYLLNGDDKGLISRVKFDLNLLVLLTTGMLLFIVILWVIEKRHYNLRSKISKIKINAFYTILLASLIFFGFNIVIYRNYINKEDPISSIISSNIDHGLDDNFRTIPMWLNNRELVEKVAKKLHISPNELRLYVVLKVLSKDGLDLPNEKELLKPLPREENIPDKMSRLINDELTVEELTNLYMYQ